MNIEAVGGMRFKDVGQVDWSVGSGDQKGEAASATTEDLSIAGCGSRMSPLVTQLCT